ncbi:GerAB/ArcD/ProY family transporter [Hathewaya massiliensis]|uniref:GerAB/ArcD/ProY family transporter n=1 Tax=Hathewaya massiliensis TaxID=1964382 RepID=UPI001157F68B|nr:GerAB/ArcD/ProY family transporter [Hathewaya massiliensis]
MKNKMSTKQYTAIIINSFLGVGILSLASELASISEQSAWISVFLGTLPSLFALVAIYFIYKITEAKDFLSLLNYLYGKLIGKIVLCFFFFYALIQNILVIFRFTLLIQMSIARYMPTYIIIGVICVLSTFVVSNNITTISRLCRFVILFAIPVLLIPSLLSFKGNITNVLPIISSYKKIFQSFPKSYLAFSGAETAFFIIYLVENENETLKASVKAIGIIAIVYAISVFSTILFLGYELTSKLIFPIIIFFELLYIPLFSDLKELFMISWSFTILSTSAIQQYEMYYVINRFFKNFTPKKMYFTVLPFTFILAIISFFYDNFRIEFLLPLSNILNLVFYLLTLLSLLISMIKYYFKEGEKN